MTNPIEITKKTPSLLLILTMFTLALTACGGGGGGGSSDSTSASPTQTTTSTSEETETEAVNGPAETSLDLQAKSTFTFTDRQSVEFSIDAQDPNGNVLPNKLVSIYKVSDEVEEWTDEHLDKAELILRGKSDDLGHFGRQLELPGRVSQVLLALSHIGIENKVLVPIEDGEVTYLFK